MKKRSNALTNRQLAVLRHIHQHIQQQGFAPSNREMCETFHISTVTGVSSHLHALVGKGMLLRPGKRSRSMTVTEAGKRALGEFPEMPGTFAYFLYDEDARCMKPLEEEKSD